MPVEVRPFVRALSLQPVPWGTERCYRGGANGTEVVAAVSGIGPVRAREAAERLLDDGHIDEVVMIGVAGALDPTLRIGDVVIPETVIDGTIGAEHHPTPMAAHPSAGVLHTSDVILSDPSALDDLARRGVVALDMETAAVGAVCEEAGVPWVAFRAISDRVQDGIVDQSTLSLTHPDGRANLGAAARLFLTKPHMLRRLARLGRDSATATRAAAELAAAHCRTGE